MTRATIRTSLPSSRHPRTREERRDTTQPLAVRPPCPVLDTLHPIRNSRCECDRLPLWRVYNMSRRGAPQCLPPQHGASSGRCPERGLSLAGVVDGQQILNVGGARRLRREAPRRPNLVRCRHQTAQIYDAIVRLDAYQVGGVECGARAQ